MSVTVTNLDKVLKQFAALENPNEVITEARKNLRAVVRKYQPLFKEATPRSDGKLIDSTEEKSVSFAGVSIKKKVKTGKKENKTHAQDTLKVKGRSRGGRTTVRLVWGVPYIGIVNFKKDNKSEKFATMKYRNIKAKLEFEGEQAIDQAVMDTAKKHGIKIK